MGQVRMGGDGWDSGKATEKESKKVKWGARAVPHSSRWAWQQQQCRAGGLPAAGGSWAAPPSCRRGLHARPGHAPPASCRCLQVLTEVAVAQTVCWRLCSEQQLPAKAVCLPTCPSPSRPQRPHAAARSGGAQTWRAVEEHAAGRRDVEPLKQLGIDEGQEDHFLERLWEVGRWEGGMGRAWEGGAGRGQRGRGAGL